LGPLNLEQNYPNPFSSFTWINYSIPEPGIVMLKIYNANGKLIRILHNGYQLEGRYSIEWDGSNDIGNQVSPGVYLYRLETASFIETKKMFRLK